MVIKKIINKIIKSDNRKENSKEKGERSDNRSRKGMDNKNFYYKIRNRDEAVSNMANISMQPISRGFSNYEKNKPNEYCQKGDAIFRDIAEFFDNFSKRNGKFYVNICYSKVPLVIDERQLNLGQKIKNIENMLSEFSPDTRRIDELIINLKEEIEKEKSNIEKWPKPIQTIISASPRYLALRLEEVKRDTEGYE